MRATLSDVEYRKEPDFYIRIARYFKIFWWVWGKNWSDYGGQGCWTIFFLKKNSPLFETSLLCGGVLDMSHQNLRSRDSRRRRLPRPSIYLSMGPFIPCTRNQSFAAHFDWIICVMWHLCTGRPVTHNIQPCCTLDFCFFLLESRLANRPWTL
jgi:hypothetical protein